MTPLQEAEYRSAAEVGRKMPFGGIATGVASGAIALCIGANCVPVERYQSWTRSKVVQTCSYVEEIVFPKIKNSTIVSPFTELIKEIEEYATLEEDWDGYGAGPIAKSVRDQAIIFLQSLPLIVSAPDTAPSADNEIVMEWEKEGTEVVVSFYGDELLHAYIDNKGKESFFDVNFLQDSIPEELISVLIELS